jgi:hypothetical protein
LRVKSSRVTSVANHVAKNASSQSVAWQIAGDHKNA